MSDILIESKSLSPLQAQAIMELMNRATITGGVAGEFLAAVLSLRRIADGTDKVSPAE